MNQLLHRLNKFTAYLEAQGAQEEARILAQTIPSFFRRNYDYGVEYQDRVKQVLRKKKRQQDKAAHYVPDVNNEGSFRRKIYNPEDMDESILEFVQQVGSKQKKRRKSPQPSVRDLSPRFKDHTVDEQNSEHMMHDPQHPDNTKSNQHSSHIAI